MNRELQFLIHISENEQISQRQLAKALSLSLGTVNGMIAQMIQQGYISVVHTQSKQSKYNLTELGLKEKNKMQYIHICDSYRTITKAKAQIKKLVEQKLKNDIKVFYILGDDDEILKLAKMSFIELKREHLLEYHHITNISEIVTTKLYCILYWNELLFDECEREGIMII